MEHHLMTVAQVLSKEVGKGTFNSWRKRQKVKKGWRKGEYKDTWLAIRWLWSTMFI